MISRCAWSTSDPLYNDKEWGKPLHNDRKLFEFLVLEGAQAGLNWLMVLKKRENYRKAFDNFDPVKIAKYNQRKINSLLNNEGIIRNKIKIQSAIQNAKAYLKVQDEFGSFDKYIWQFTDGKTIQNSWVNIKNIPAISPVSDGMSKDLKKRGFNFVGSTICYAFMQATGIVNDHTKNCFRYKELR
jgi:DNA-3-methyladenine glycosylase I